MRADRFLAAERVEGFARSAHVPLGRWPHDMGNADEERVMVRARVNARGAKGFELASLFGRLPPSGGTVETEIPKQELDYYASRLLCVGTEVAVESPHELSQVLRRKAEEIATLYD